MYLNETFTAEESDVLRRYFTNLDKPVFALVNLPEVVKGALFARYSRSAKSLRRLFLDEFVGDLDVTGDLTIDATIGLERAEALYDRVFFEYGDDSVAQLGGVHLACEQASNILTKILEWGRLASYLEQSTRYIAYDARLGNGRYRYYRDPSVLESNLGARYVGDMDFMFDTYAELLPQMQTYYAGRFPKEPGYSDFAWRRSVRAKALDALRGLLPAASLSNVGIYGSGQSYEMLLMRMRAHPLPEAREYAEMMAVELRKVIPSFLKRLDVPERGGAWVDYMASNRARMEEVADALVGQIVAEPRPLVTLTDFDPDGEAKVVAAALYPFTSLPDDQLLDRARQMTDAERGDLLKAYVGERGNRRHRPGRALERTSYRFDVVSDYGAFRDLQRHRMLTVEWQPFTNGLGYELPADVADAGLASRFEEVLECSSDLFDELADRFPSQAPYALSLAFRIRYSMQMNAREAMHVLELRSSTQGHPAYRVIAQEMHRQIAEVAGHRSIAEAMRFVEKEGASLERLEAERRREARLAARDH
jgi:thymidylate synthase ThyX